jgi:hypothetical protein
MIDALWNDVFRAGLRASDCAIVVRFTERFARSQRNRMLRAAIALPGMTSGKVAAIFNVSPAIVRMVTRAG